MKIKTTDKCKSIDNKPVKPDSVHDVDSNTARNLIKKGFATAADDEAKRLDLEESSRLTEDQADANAEKIADKREADKEKADAASKKKR